LDLDELQALGPRQQCDRILAAVLGDGNHPDEHALRRAAAEQLKDVLGRPDPPQPIEVIENLIAGFVHQLGLLEIRAQMKTGLDLNRVVAMERDLKRYISARVRSVRDRFTTTTAIPVAQIKDVAARIGQEAIRVIRAGAPA